ncbi:MAG: LAGLIDADG family homing endonuclease, partial [Patescibacteria group bacterium]
MPVYKKVNKNFFKTWTPEMAYILGFFSADGYITVNKRGGQFWCIQITDKKLLEEIKKAIKSEHKISTRVGGRNESTLYRLQIGSIEMCDDLRKLGLRERKTKSLVVPNVPDKYLADFARGYFDGDGNVWMGFLNKKRNRPILALKTMFTSCSLDFLNQFHKKLREFGTEGGSVYLSRGNYSRLQFSSNDSLKIYNFMYNQCVSCKISLFLERKK